MSSKKVFLLDENKNRYKANLHCHSTISDGIHSPQQLKELYKSNGYSVLAYTDHEVLVLHNDLTDEGFLAMPGYEVQTFGDKHLPKLMRRVSHMNFYPKNPTNNKLPFFSISDLMQLDRPPDFSAQVYDGEGNDVREYSAEGLNALIAKAKEQGFIVSLNHPTWSKEDASLYTNLEGIFAVEIYNHGCSLAGYDCYCPIIYEEMLRSGQRIGCIATDDTHHDEDLFGGFTMIYADELKHEKIIAALEKGDFYASCGPVIESLWYENGIFHIECSPAKQIVLSNSGRRKPNISVRRAEHGSFLTVAEFPICENDLYVRFTVTDEAGRAANTRAYWREEFEDTPAAIPNICSRKIGK